jgi:E3 ubiquitin-protein ligase DOA10
MNDEECLICLENIQDSDIAILSCKHYLHYECLKEWCNKRNNFVKLCPICDTETEIKNIYTIDKKYIVPKETRPSPISINQSKNIFWCCQIL